MIHILTIISSCSMAAFTRYIRMSYIVKRIIFMISIMIPALVAALRYNNGPDYFLYMEIFKSIYFNQEFISVKAIEPGYLLLVKFCTLVSDSPVFMYFVIAYVIVFFYYRGCWKLSPNYIFSILLFFISGTYFDTWNGLRQYIAAATIFWGIQYIFQKNKKKYLLTVIIASMFHASALIMLPVYYVGKLNFNVKRSLGLGVIAVVAGNVIFQGVTYLLQFTRFSYYLSSVEYVVSPTIGSIVCTTAITFLTFFIVYFHKKEMSNSQQIFFNLQILTWLSALISFSIPLALRLQYYFLPLELIILPNLLILIPKRSRMICILLIIIGYASITTIGILEHNWFDCYPYNFYYDYYD